MDIHVQVEICTADGDTFPVIRYARACMMDIHVQVEICTADGDTFSEIRYARECMYFVQFTLIMTTANTYFPGTFMYSSLLLRL